MEKQPVLTSNLVWDDLKLFLAIVEAGSINQAAQKLGLGQATVSRRLAELETQVGHGLFLRSAAGVTLTSIGEQMLAPIRRMAEWATEVSRAAAAGDAEIAGVVRVTAAPLVCATLLTQFAAHLRRVHPKLQLEVLSTVRYLDLARGEADLAVRAVLERHADLVSVARFSHQNHVYVSRRLAKQLASQLALPAPLQLAALPWLAWSTEFEQLPPNPQLRSLIPNFKPVFTADSFIVMAQAAEAGVGAMILPELVVQQLHRTNLVPLPIGLGEYQNSTTHIVGTARALKLPKVRAVADELARFLRTDVGEMKKRATKNN